MKDLDELKAIREQARKELELREGIGSRRIVVGMGTCGIAAGARDVMKTFLEEIEKNDSSGVAVTATGCDGNCDKEPIVDVVRDGNSVRYTNVNKDKARRIFSEHIVKGTPVEEQSSE